MFVAEAHPEDGYLYVRIEGLLNMAESMACAEAVIREGHKLHPGFTIINDISQTRPNSPEIAEVIKRGQTALYAMGAVRAIRIIGGAGGAQLQFARMQRESRVTYETLTVGSLDEAVNLVHTLKLAESY